MRILISPTIISIISLLTNISTTSARGEVFRTNARLDFMHNSTVLSRGQDKEQSLPLKKRNVVTGVQEKSQRLSSVDRHAFLNDMTQRIMEADASETCQYENEKLDFFRYINSYNDPFWFYYSGKENGPFGKDYSSYFDPCITSLTGSISCDFTNLSQAIKGPCEMEGGVLYSFSSVHTCSNGQKITDTNFPICAGESCAIDKDYFTNNANFNFCGEDSIKFDLEVTKEEPIMSKECKAERSTFTEASGFGDPDYVFSSSSIDTDNYCVSEETTTGTSENCDFTPLLTNLSLEKACEAEGGILYKFSDSLTTTYESGTSEESVHLNVPLCIGASCIAQDYFEKLVFPLYDFILDGDFKEDGNSNHTSTYTSFRYAPVSPTPSPSSSPTSSSKATEYIWSPLFMTMAFFWLY
jgi:hypothetical protein